MLCTHWAQATTAASSRSTKTHCARYGVGHLPFIAVVPFSEVQTKCSSPPRGQQERDFKKRNCTTHRRHRLGGFGQQKSHVAEFSMDLNWRHAAAGRLGAQCPRSVIRVGLRRALVSITQISRLVSVVLISLSAE